MIKLLRLLQGYIVFEAEGGFVERFLNLCKINNINLWGVKNDSVKVVAFTNPASFSKIKIPAEKSGMNITIVKKCGLPFFAKAHKWRCGAVLGLLIVVFTIWLLSGYVWEVEVVTNDNVKIKGFTEKLSELGVSQGAKKSQIDILDVQEQLLDSFSELSWVSVNIFGTKAQVEYSYAKPQKQIVDKSSPTNIVADKNGKVIRVEGYSGVNMVKAGDYVAQGALLISGVVKNADSSENFTHASGKIFAYTQNEIIKEKTLNQKCSVVCEQSDIVVFCMFGLKIPFGKIPSESIISQTDIFLEGNGTVLPIGFTRNDCFIVAAQEIQLSSAECMLQCLLESVIEKRQYYNSTELKSVGYCCGGDQDTTSVITVIECVENIATEKAICVE